jgi:hypothetical protein
MAFLDRDKDAAARVADLAARDQLGLDGRPVLA